MRYKMIITYDGTFFSGFQRQSNLETVQSKVEEKLKIIFKSEIEIKAAGRTDVGVHAIGQVIHFDSDILIPINNLRKVLNRSLAPHIYIKKIEITTIEFHARFSPHMTEYHYLISTNEFDPLRANYYYFYNHVLNLDLLKKACKLFVGTKDFKSLCKGNSKENTIRTIYYFDIEEEEGVYKFIIKGNGFLHNMVRIIIALLLKINENKISIQELENIIEGKNRKLAPWTAPGCGLYLYKISYEKN